MEAITRKRKDTGPRLTDRDLNALGWIAQQYAIALDHLCVLLARLSNPNNYAQKPKEEGELTVKRTAKIVKRWEQLGLVERGWILHGDPMWIWLTPLGLRTIAEQLGELRPYTPTAATVNHLYWVNHVRLYLEGEEKSLTWTSERQIRTNQKSEQGIQRPHTPDAIAIIDHNQIAIEVELSTKTYNRLNKILRELADNDDYDSIWYYVQGRANQMIRKAINDLPAHYHQRFMIYDVDEMEIA